MSAAFAADPPARWLLPEEAAFRRGFAGLARLLARLSAKHGAFDLSEGGEAAAIWLPPRVAPGKLEILSWLGRAAPWGRLPPALVLYALMEARRPRTPHWYLPLIGVLPGHTGNGIGGALLQRGLDRCERDDKAAYLEATTEANARLYARYGFVEVGEIRFGSAPPLRSMIRRPRSAAAHLRTDLR